MASKKVQLPVLGGLRKVIKVGDDRSENPGTTIREFANQIITLAQLRAALGLTPQILTPPPGGGSSSASLIVGPGLTGGGPLIGSVPLGLTGPLSVFLPEDGASGEDGPPGQRGADGVIGVDGAPGPAIFLSADDGQDGLDGIPGGQGPAGNPGAAGINGPAVFMAADDGEDGIDAIPGSPGVQGPAGTSGLPGPAIFMIADDGADGEPGPPGVSGSSATPQLSLDAEILADNPVGFWKCNDASGGFVDSSGNGFDLTTVTGTVNFQFSPLIPSLGTTSFACIGNPNSALANNSVSLTSQLGLTYPLLDWTIEAFVVLQSTTNGNAMRVFDVRQSGSSVAAATLAYIINTGWVLFYPPNSNQLTIARDVRYETTHVAITCSSSGGNSTLTYYINGVRTASVTVAQSTHSGTMLVSIGALGGGVTTAPFGIGYVSFYDSALPTARITAHAVAAGKFSV